MHVGMVGKDKEGAGSMFCYADHRCPSNVRVHPVIRKAVDKDHSKDYILLGGGMGETRRRNQKIQYMRNESRVRWLKQDKPSCFIYIFIFTET